MTARTLIAALCLVWIATATAAERRWDRGTERERMLRRFDSVAAAARKQAAMAEGKWPGGADGEIVLGDRDPELLMRWELMDRLAGVLKDDHLRLKYEGVWSKRIAESGLDRDLVARLQAAAARFLEADAELTRVHMQINGGSADDTGSLKERASQLNRAMCGLRADALAAARAAVGSDVLDRFLYEVVAPDAVVITSASSNPNGTADLWLWVEEGCR